VRVSEALQVVRDRLLEVSGDGPFTDDYIVRQMNEGIRHLREKMCALDPGGQWFAEEVDLTYPANTRWYTPTTVPGFSLNIYTCMVLDGSGTTQASREVAIIDPRREQDWQYGRIETTSSYALMIRGNRLGLRVRGSEYPPAQEVPLRILYLPSTPVIDTSVLGYASKVIGVDYAFPLGYVDAIIAYAVVMCQMAQDVNASEWQRLYNQLEADLLNMVQNSRANQGMPNKLRIMNRNDYE